MDIRFDGRELRFEEVYPHAPYAELIRLAVAGASAVRHAAEAWRLPSTTGLPAGADAVAAAAEPLLSPEPSMR